VIRQPLTPNAMMTRAAVFTEILDKLFQEKKLSFVMPVSSTSRSSTMMINIDIFLIHARILLN